MPWDVRTVGEVNVVPSVSTVQGGSSDAIVTVSLARDVAGGQ